MIMVRARGSVRRLRESISDGQPAAGAGVWPARGGVAGSERASGGPRRGLEAIAAHSRLQHESRKVAAIKGD